MLGIPAKSRKEEQTDSVKPPRPTDGQLPTEQTCNAEKPPPEGTKILMYGFKVRGIQALIINRSFMY